MASPDGPLKLDFDGAAQRPGGARCGDDGQLEALLK